MGIAGKVKIGAPEIEGFDVAAIDGEVSIDYDSEKKAVRATCHARFDLAGKKMQIVAFDLKNDDFKNIKTILSKAALEVIQNPAACAVTAASAMLG